MERLPISGDMMQIEAGFMTTRFQPMAVKVDQAERFALIALWSSISCDKVERESVSLEDLEMAVVIDARGNLALVSPENGRSFSLSEPIQLMGPQLSNYELECATAKNLGANDKTRSRSSWG